jgi:hypothetical protein
MSWFESDIIDMIAEGMFDEQVILRATELINRGDMDITFYCDDSCSKCDDCERPSEDSPRYNDGME